MNAAIPCITPTLSVGNEQIRRALNLALAQVLRLERQATVLAIEIVGEKPVITIDRPLANGHYVTRSVDGRRLTLWVAQEGCCQLECESPQPLPPNLGSR